MSVKKSGRPTPPPGESEPSGGPGNAEPAGLQSPLRVHPSETPASRHAALVKALLARRIPGRLLYRSAEQARRWLDYHGAWSPSRTDPSLAALYRDAARETADEMALEVAGGSGRGQLPLLVGLGCGDGSKDAVVLEALAGGDGDGSAYAPVDASPELVLRAAAEAVRRIPGVALHPLVADLSTEPSLSGFPDSSSTGSRRRLFTAYGLLPNMHHRAFPRWLAGLIGPGDRLLLSANLYRDGAGEAARAEASCAPAADILAQYDNPLARRWYAGCLSELGIPGDAYRFLIESLPLEDQQGPLEGAFQISVRARLEASVRVKFTDTGAGGEAVDEGIVYQAGEALAVFHSNRFTAGTVQHLLRQAGLAVTRRWIHPSAGEGVFACRRP